LETEHGHCRLSKVMQLAILSLGRRSMDVDDKLVKDLFRPKQ